MDLMTSKFLLYLPQEEDTSEELPNVQEYLSKVFRCIFCQKETSYRDHIKEHILEHNFRHIKTQCACCQKLYKSGSII